MQIEHITDASSIAGLGPAWDALLERSATRSPFLRRAWVETWWAVFGDRFRMHLLLARDADGALQGAAPWMVGRGPGRLLGRLPHLMLWGQQGETLAEHLDLLAPSDAVAHLVPAFCEAALALDDRWDVLLFQRVPEDSPSLPALEAACAAHGLETERTAVHPSPYAMLPSSFDAWTASKSRNFRRQLKNAQNRLEREGPVALRIAGRDIDVDEAFDHLVRLHRARWGEGEGSFATPRYLEFHRRLCHRLVAEDGVCLALLQVGDRMVAARYDFVYAGKVWCFQGGRLPEMERMRPGTVLTAMVFAWAIEKGYREYDFLSGGEAYKDRWADGERRLVDLRVLRDRPRVRWARRLQRAKDAARRKLGRAP